jgi:hypothetical protein
LPSIMSGSLRRISSRLSFRNNSIWNHPSTQFSVL